MKPDIVELPRAALDEIDANNCAQNPPFIGWTLTKRCPIRQMMMPYRNKATRA